MWQTSGKRMVPAWIVFLVAATVIPAGTLFGARAEDSQKRSDDKYTLDKLRHERKQMAQRKRRIVFNNDGDELWRGTDGTREGVLAARTTGLAGSHVDAIWQWGSDGFKLIHQNGPFARLYTMDRNGPNYQRAFKAYQTLMDDCGKDNLEIMIDFCREHGMEIFYSNRMNDVHDSYFPGRLYITKIEHPEWCLSTKEKAKRFHYPDPRSSWSAWNFEVPEIRQLTVDALREVCQTYDIDGIELDYWRHLVNFPEMLRGQPVTPQNLKRINQLMRDIRRMSEEEGLRRGRPILLCGRCVEDVEVSKQSGLDIATWLQEDLVDILSMAYGTEHFPPVYSITSLAKKYDVPVYPMINSYDIATTEPTSDGSKRRGNLPVWRGDALNKFEQGAAGLQTFNLFGAHWQQFRELGDPNLLLTLDRTYVWYYLPSQRRGRNTFGALRTTRHRHPVTVTVTGCEPMPLYLGEDLSAPNLNGKPRTLMLRVRANDLTALHGLSISVNGATIRQSETVPELGDEAEVVWIYYQGIDGDLFTKGKNLVTAVVKTETAQPVKIDQVRLDVRYND